jgi:long-chain acyl-CoA synthetase
MEGVHDCAVFGIPEEELGEVLTAVIELEEGANVSEEDVLTYLAERIAKYKLPRSVHFRDNLPREDSGKLFKRKLRDEFWKAAGRNI